MNCYIRTDMTKPMVDKILKFADESDMLPDAGLVLACVSGGADSMCLLEILLEISQSRGFSVAAAHYNHRLRGDESDSDEAFVRAICEARSVPFFCSGGDVRAYALKNGLSLEEAARDMRYGFFYEAAARAGAARIATAHTADDNAETVIINLTRGAGAQGLSGIPPKRDKLIRPMLRISRDEVMGFILERGVAFCEDSTNSLDIFTRNKIRLAVMPVLKEINPRLNEAASALTELLRADEEYLSEVAGRYIEEHCADGAADAKELLDLPPAVSGRVIRKLCGGGKLSRGHVKAVLELCRRGGPSACVSLPGITVCREYENIVFGVPNKALGFNPVYPLEGQTLMIENAGLKITCKTVMCDGTINKSFSSFLFKKLDICGKISVRPRLEGDVIRFFGQNGAKTLKKLFIERKIPARKRTLIPVIADESGVLAVYGLGIGSRAVPSPGDIAIQIEFETAV